MPQPEMRDLSAPVNAGKPQKTLYEQYSALATPGPAAGRSNRVPDDEEDDEDEGEEEAQGLLNNAASAPSSKKPNPDRVAVVGDDDDEEDDDEDEDEDEEDDPFDPETMLYAAADKVYFQGKRKRSLASMKSSFLNRTNTSRARQMTHLAALGKPDRNPLSRVAGWYTPTYDYMSPGMSDAERKRPRYCGGSLKKWQFVLAHFAFLAGMAFVTLAPIMYFIIIPQIIQNTLNQTGMDQITLNNLDVNAFKPASVGFHLFAQIRRPTIFPVRAGLGDLTLHIVDEQNNLLMDAQVPAMQFWIDREIVIDMDAKVSFEGSNTPALQKLMLEFSTVGLVNRTFTARMNAKISVFGIPVYWALPLYKAFPVSGVQNNLVSVFSALPNFARVSASNMNNLIENEYANDPSSLITFVNATLFPKMAIQSLDIAVTDTGMTLGVGVRFQNPTMISLRNFESAEVGFALEGTDVARVKVSNISLTDSIQTLNLVADVAFDTSNPAAITAAIGDAVQRILFLGDYNVKLAVTGPISLVQTGYVQKFTDKFELVLPTDQLLSSFNFDRIKSLLTPSGIAEIISNSSITADVTSKGIAASALVALAKFLPLPPKVSFPYHTSLGIYGGSHEIMTMKLDPININTNRTTMSLGAGINIVPVNTQAAATALAAAINPILAANPTNSSINIGQIYIMKPDNKTHFAWTDALFGPASGAPITINIPANVVNTTSIIDMLTDNESSLPISIASLNMTQLDDAPGFGVKGLVGIMLPTTIDNAHLNVNLGYAGATVMAESQKLAAAQLLSGLVLPAPNNQTNINANMILSPSSAALTKSLQNLVNSFVIDNAPASSIGVTGLEFGPSQPQAFITFSKVQIELSTAGLKNLVSKTVTGLEKSILKPGAIRPNRADLQVVTSTNLTATIGAQIKNPTGVQASVGSLALAMSLGGSTLASLAADPVSLLTGTTNLTANARLTIATGANGMAKNVAQLANALLAVNSTFAKAPSISVGGITLTPANNASAAAKIDQLAGVTVTLPASLLDILNPLAGGGLHFSATSPIDLSALLPGSDFLSRLAIKPQAVDIIVGQNSTISGGAAVGYNNPYALAGKFPYLQASMGLGDAADVVDMKLTTLQLLNGPGVLAPGFSAIISKDPKAAVAVAALVDGVVKTDRVNVPVVVGGLGFGASPTDVSDLLSLVSVDVSPLIANYSVGGFINDIIAQVLPFRLPATISDLESFLTSSAAGGSLAINTLPQKSIGVKTPGLQLALPFELTVECGYISAAMGIDANPLVVLNVPAGIKASTSGGKVMLAVDATAQFVDTDATQTSVADLIKAYFAGVTFGTTAVHVSKLGLGYSQADQITALSQVDLGLALANLIKLTGPSDVSSLLGSLHPSVTGTLDIVTKPSNNLAIGVSAGMKLPFAISASVGYVASKVDLDINPLTVFTLPSGIAVQSDPAGNVNLGVNTTLQLIDNDGTRTEVASIVNNLVAGKMLGASVVLSGLGLGASATDTITALNKVVLPLNLDAAIQVLLGMPASSAFNLPSLLKGLNPSLGATTIETKPQKTLALNTAVEFTFTLPISVNFQTGYFAAQSGLGGNDLASFSLPGLSLDAGKVGANRIALKIAPTVVFDDTDATQTTIAEVADKFFNGARLSSTLDLVNIGIGASASDTLSILSKVAVHADLDLLADAVFPRNGATDVASLLSSLHPSVTGAIGITTQPSNHLGVSAAAGLILGFPVSATVGYVSSNIGLNANPLTVFQLPQGIAVAPDAAGVSRINVNTSLALLDNDGTRTDVANLVNNVLAGKPLGASVVLSQLGLGYSSTDTITALNKVSLPVSLDSALQVLLGSDASQAFSLTTLLKDLNPSIGATTVVTKPQKTLDLSTNVAFNFAIPISINFQAGYFAAQSGLGGDNLATFSLPGLALNALNGTKRMSLAIAPTLVFDDSDATQTTIASVANNFFSGAPLASTLDLVNLGIGVSQSDTLSILSKVAVHADLDILVNAIYPRNGPTDVATLLKGFSPSVSGTVGIVTQPLNHLGVSASAGLKLPFPVTANLGYLGSNIGLNSNPLAQFVLPTGINVAPDAAGAIQLNVNTSLALVDNEGTQTDVATLVNNFLAGKSLNANVVLSGLALGASPSDTITALNKVDLPLSLDAAIALFLGAAPGTLTLPNLLKDLNPSIGATTVETKPQKTLELSTNVAFNFALPIAVSFQAGYFAAQSGLGGNNLATFSLPGLSLKPGNGTNRIALSIAPTLAFDDSDATQTTVANVANNFFAGSPLGSTLDLVNVGIGASSSDTLSVLSKVAAHVDLDEIVNAVYPRTGPIDLATLLQSLNPSVSGAVGIVTQPSNHLGVSVAAGLKLPFPVSATLGYLGSDVGLNANPLANFVLPTGIAIAPDATGAVALKVNTSLALTDNDATRTDVANLVNNLLASKPFGANVVLSGLSIGASQSDQITALSKVALPLSLDAAVQILLGVAPGTVLNLPTLLKNLDPSLGATTVSTKPQKTLDLSTDLAFNLALPLSVSFQAGYFAAQSGIGGDNLATFSLPGLALTALNGTNRMALKIAPTIVFDDSDATQTTLAAVANNFFSGAPLASTVDLVNVGIGASSMDTLSVLSKVNVHMDLDMIVEAVFNRTGPTDLASLLQTFMPSIGNSLAGSVGIKTLPANHLGVSANVALKLPFPITANLGYLGSSIALDSNPLANFLLADGLKVAPLAFNGTVINVNTSLALTDNAATQTGVANLVNNLVGNKPLGSFVQLSALQLGSSASDTITALNKVVLPLSLDAAIGLVLGTEPGTGFNIQNIISNLNASIGATTVETKPQKTLDLSTSLAFTLSVPISVNFEAGYFAAQSGLGGNSLATFSLPGVFMRPADGTNRIALNIAPTLVFDDTDATQTTIAMVANNFFSGAPLASTLDLVNVGVGASQSDTLSVLSKINVHMDLDMLVNAIYPRSGPTDVGTLLSSLSPSLSGTVGVAVQPANHLGVRVAAGIKLPFPVSATIGYLASNVGLDSNPLAIFSLPTGTVVKPDASGNATLNIDTVLQMVDNAATQTTVANIVNNLVASKPLGSSVELSALGIGASATDTITALNKVVLPLSLDSAIQILLGTAPGAGLSIASLLSNLNPAIGATSVNTLPQKSLSLSTNVAFNLALPISISFKAGYLAAATALGQNPLATFSLPGFDLEPAAGGRQNLSIAPTLQFDDTDATQTTLATVVNNFFAGTKLASTLGLSSLQVGASSTDLLTVVSKINTQLDLDMVADAVYPRSGPTDVASLLKGLNPSVGGVIGIETLPANSLGLNADVALKLPFALQASVGFVQSTIAIDNNPLTMLGLPNGIKVTPDASNNANLSVSTTLKMQDNDATQTTVAALVNRLVSGQSLSTSVEISGLLLGNSATDTFTALSKVSLPLSLDAAIAIVLGTNQPLVDITTLLQNLNPSIGTTTVTTLPNKALSLNTTVAFGLNLPFQVTFKAGFLSALAGIGGNPLTSFALPGLSLSALSGGRTSLSVDTDLNFVDTEATQTALANLVNNFLSGAKVRNFKAFANDLITFQLATTADVSQLKIGASATDLLTVVSKVDAGIDLDLVVNAVFPRKGPVDVASYIAKFLSQGINDASGVKISKASLMAQPKAVLNANLGATIALPLPFEVVLNIGYFSVGNANIDSIALLGATVSNFVYDANNNTNLAAVIAINESQAMADKIRDVLAGFFNNGKFPSSFGVGQLSMGATSTDVITALNKVAVSIAIDPIGQVLAKYVQSLVTNFINDIPGGQLGSLGNTNGPISINLGQNISVILNNLDAQFQPADLITVAIGAGLDFPFPVEASLPYMSFAIQLDDVPAIGGDVTGFNVVGGATSALKLGSNIQVHDTDNLANKVAAIASAFFGNQPLPGNVIISNLAFGMSEQDAIKDFSEASIPISLSYITGPFLTGLNKSIDVVDLIKRFVFLLDPKILIIIVRMRRFQIKLNNVAVQSQPGRQLSANVGASFNDAFPLAVSLPFIGLGVGLDAVDMASATVSGLALTPGSNTLKLGSLISIPSSSSAQDKVAAFVANLVNNGLGHTSESIAASGISLGYSATDNIQALSKARILVPSATVLNTEVVNAVLAMLGLSSSQLTVEGLINLLVVKGLNVDASQAGKIHLDAAAGLALNLSASANFGYVGLDALLDNAPYVHLLTGWLSLAKDLCRLTSISIPTGVSIQTVGGDVLVNLSTDLYLDDSDPLETAIATLVNQFVGSGPFTSKAGASGVVFGQTKDDSIDLLSKATIALALDPILEPVKKMLTDIINGVMAGTGPYSLALNAVDVNWLSTTGIAAGGKATIGGLPSNITVNIPYFAAVAEINGQEFILPEVNDITFNNGAAAFAADVNFKQNDAAAQTLIGIVGNVAFHRQATYKDTAGIKGIVFGASKDSVFKLASKASVSLGLDQFVQPVWKFFDEKRPLELLNIQSAIHHDGIFAHITCTTLPSFLPLTVNLASVVGQVNWKMGGVQDSQEYTVVNAIFTNMVVKPNQPIVFDLLMAPDTGPLGFMTPLNEAILYLIEFQDYAQHASLGHITVWEKEAFKGTPFGIFSNSGFHAPDLYLWQPITLEPKITHLFTSKGISFDLNFWWPNPGPLHLEIGIIQLFVQDNGQNILTLESPGPVIVKNELEGARAGDINSLVNNRVTITIPWSDFNPFTFFVKLIDLLHPLAHYKIVIQTIVDGRPVNWLDMGLQQLPGDLIANILPVLVSLLGKIKLDIFGFKISASLIPGLNSFLNAAAAKLDALPPKHWSVLDDL
ncbi:hypothetical protein HK101_008517 [Irineochytrium annulatum]|nr:hypothetical protein HK101_008517 [Irineochytrium annulatum]